MARYAVGVLVLASVGALAWMLWPAKPGPVLDKPGDKPGKQTAAWKPGAVLDNVVSTLSGNKAAGERAGSVVASNAAKAAAAVDKARNDAGATFSGWLASVAG